MTFGLEEQQQARTHAQQKIVRARRTPRAISGPPNVHTKSAMFALAFNLSANCCGCKMFLMSVTSSVAPCHFRNLTTHSAYSFVAPPSIRPCFRISYATVSMLESRNPAWAMTVHKETTSNAILRKCNERKWTKWNVIVRLQSITLLNSELINFNFTYFNMFDDRREMLLVVKD